MYIVGVNDVILLYGVLCGEIIGNKSGLGDDVHCRSKRCDFAIWRALWGDNREQKWSGRRLYIVGSKRCDLAIRHAL